MDLTTIAKMLVSFTRIDSGNIMLAQTPVFMGVPNVGKTDSFDGYSCVAPDKGSIAEPVSYTHLLHPAGRQAPHLHGRVPGKSGF